MEVVNCCPDCPDCPDCAVLIEIEMCQQEGFRHVINTAKIMAKEVIGSSKEPINVAFLNNDVFKLL